MSWHKEFFKEIDMWTEDSETIGGRFSIKDLDSKRNYDPKLVKLIEEKITKLEKQMYDNVVNEFLRVFKEK